MNISTKIAGIEISRCTMNAAGVLDTSLLDLDRMKRSVSGAMVSKSSTYKKRKGNEEPRLYIGKNGTINSTGLANEGYKFYTDYSKTVIEKPFIQSIAPFSIKEMTEMLLYIETSIDNPMLVEINPSCPNIKGKAIVAYDHIMLQAWLTSIERLTLKNVKIGIKLPPYYVSHDFDVISELIRKFTFIKFITCVNSIPNGLFIDIKNESTCIKPNEGLGGIGGDYIKPIALANVYQFNKRIGNYVDIISCGGIKCGGDLFEHILAGGKAGAIGSAILTEGENIFERVHNDLKDIMRTKNYNCIEDFRGKLKICD